MGVVPEGIAGEEASNWQNRDLKYRAAKLNLSYQDQALAAKNDLFFKERSDA
jgi:hypothetical protein